MHQAIVSKIRNNAWIFLRRSIKALVEHDDARDEGLTEERAIITVALTQTAFELSLMALFIQKNGLKEVARRKDASKTEEDLLFLLNSNELKTENFDTLKMSALEKKWIDDEDDSRIEQFQSIRNKLMHIHYNFHEGDLFDMKYDVTNFIIHTIIPTLSTDCCRPSEAIKRRLDESDFKKLIKFPPYAWGMHQRAKEDTDLVYDCIACGNNSLSTDSNDTHCYSCCEDYDGAKFIDCTICQKKSSVIYDALNIHNQDGFVINGRCLSCKNTPDVCECQKCFSTIALNPSLEGTQCNPDFCANGH